MLTHHKFFVGRCRTILDNFLQALVALVDTIKCVLVHLTSVGLH